MRRQPSGFTLIELLIVISIIGALAAVLAPQLMGSRAAANVSTDALQMRTHAEWLLVYENKFNNALPNEGGHKFVLSTWKVIDQTAENFDRYFAPGARNDDPYYQELRMRVLKGENPWPNVKDCTSTDTHYAGRAKDKLRTARASGNEAWMADDNEGVWTHPDGSVNILLASGQVRSLSYQQLQELYSLPEFDANNPIETWGPNSPIEICRTLDR